MKHILLIFLPVLFFSHCSMAQEKNDFLRSELISGCPPEIEFIKESMNLTDLSYSYLDTGIDTLEVMFGEFTQGSSKGYWIYLSTNKKLLSWTTVQLSNIDVSHYPSNSLDIEYNNQVNRISVNVAHNPATNEIIYQWLNMGLTSNTATIQTIDVPIQINKEMPLFNVKSLSGKEVAIDDFKGKFLVINWWATTCGPCIVEMPGLNELVEKYQARSDVKFIAIAMDDKAILKNFLSKRDFKYDQHIFNKENIEIFGNSFPKHIIVNPEGMVTYYSQGGSPDVHHAIDVALKSQLK